MLRTKGPFLTQLRQPITRSLAAGHIPSSTKATIYTCIRYTRQLLGYGVDWLYTRRMQHPPVDGNGTRHDSTAQTSPPAASTVYTSMAASLEEIQRGYLHDGRAIDCISVQMARTRKDDTIRVDWTAASSCETCKPVNNKVPRLLLLFQKGVMCPEYIWFRAPDFTHNRKLAILHTGCSSATALLPEPSLPI